MAGRGPAPGANPNRKPPGHARRPNRGAALEPLPADGYAGKHPALPKTYRQLVWDPKAQKHRSSRVTYLAETRAWYKAWATSALAHEFTEVHWLRLREIAQLKDRLERGDLRVAGEYRQAIAAFGGTPQDLRRLGKRPASPASESDTNRPPAQVRRLRAVDTNAVAGS